MIPEQSKKLFLEKYYDFGSERFYEFLENYALDKVNDENKKAHPELELLGYYNKFVSLFRKEKDQVYLDIAKLFRRAANKTYRVMLKREIITKNNKFLNVVK